MHAYGRRGRARAGEPRCDLYVAHTETESAANALTYDGLLLREAVRRSALDARTYVCASASARARPSGAKPRKLVYLGRAFFFRFRTTGTFRGIFSVYPREIPRTNRFAFPRVRAALTVAL